MKKIIIPKLNEIKWVDDVLAYDTIYRISNDRTSVRVDFRYHHLCYVKFTDLFKNLLKNDTVIGMHIDLDQNIFFIAFKKTGIYYAKMPNKKLYKSNKWTLHKY